MDSPKRRPSQFIVTITAMMTIFARQARRLPRKLKAATSEPTTNDDMRIQLRSPKKLLSSISSKTLSFIQKRNKKKVKEDWGDGGVWQKAILMGDRCEPLDFSGVIYYDSNGKQVNEIPPKSPRVSPVPGYFVRHNQQHDLLLD